MSISAEALARSVYLPGMNGDAHVEVCLREEERWTRVVSVRHEWPHHYDLERMIDHAECNDEGVRRSTDARRREFRRALWTRTVTALRLERERRAKVELSWRAWDVPGRLERLVAMFVLMDRCERGTALPAHLDRDDLAQEVRLHVEAKLHLFTPRTSIGAWVRVVAKNIVFEQLRRKRRRSALLDVQGEFTEDEVEGRSFLSVEQWNYLNAVLSSPDAKLLFLRYLVDEERKSSLTKTERQRVRREKVRLREEESGRGRERVKPVASTTFSTGKTLSGS